MNRKKGVSPGKAAVFSIFRLKGRMYRHFTLIELLVNSACFRCDMPLQNDER